MRVHCHTCGRNYPSSSMTAIRTNKKRTNTQSGFLLFCPSCNKERRRDKAYRGTREAIRSLRKQSDTLRAALYAFEKIYERGVQDISIDCLERLAQETLQELVSKRTSQEEIMKQIDVLDEQIKGILPIEHYCGRYYEYSPNQVGNPEESKRKNIKRAEKFDVGKESGKETKAKKEWLKRAERERERQDSMDRARRSRHEKLHDFSVYQQEIKKKERLDALKLKKKE